MAYLTLNGSTYKVRLAGTPKGRRIPLEHRRRAVAGNLLIDNIADKKEVTLEFLGGASARFTTATGDTFMDLLADGNVTVAGDLGSFTARARDIGYTDVRYSGGVLRIVSATLEEV